MTERSWTAAREHQTVPPPNHPHLLLHDSSDGWIWITELLMSHVLCFLLGWMLRGRTRSEPKNHAPLPSDVTNGPETCRSLTEADQTIIPERQVAASLSEQPLPLGLRERTLSKKQKGFERFPIKSTKRGLAKKSSSQISSSALVIKVDQAAIRSLTLPLVAFARCLQSFGQSLESISNSLRSASEAKSSIQRQAMWCRCFRIGLWIMMVTLVLCSVRGGRVATVFRSCAAGGAEASSKPIFFKWPWSLVYSSAFRPLSSKPQVSNISSLGSLICISHGLGLHALALAAVWQVLIPLLRHSSSSGSIIMGFSSSNQSQLERGDLVLDLGVGFGIIGSAAGAYLTSCLGGYWPVFIALWILWIVYLSASIAAEATGDGKKGSAEAQGSFSKGLKILFLSSLLPILIGSLPFHPAVINVGI